MVFSPRKQKFQTPNQEGQDNQPIKIIFPMKTGYFAPQIIEVSVVGIFEYFEVFFQGFFGRNKTGFITISLLTL